MKQLPERARYMGIFNAVVKAGRLWAPPEFGRVFLAVHNEGDGGI